jgi:hypothetical protein
VSAVVDKYTQEKIDIIKARLIKNFGYDEVSAEGDPPAGTRNRLSKTPSSTHDPARNCASSPR